MPDRNVVTDSNPKIQEEHQAKHGMLSTITTFIGDHVALSIGVAIGFVLVAFVLSKRKTTPATNVGTSTTASAGCVDSHGQAIDCGSSQAVGSLGNAGYQDSGVAYALTQLGQQLNNLQATLNAPPPVTTPNPTPTPTPGAPIIPAGQFPSGVKWATGSHLVYGGNPYTLIVGSGRLYGVPGFVSAQQALTVQNAPLLYQIPNWTGPKNAMASHSPIQSFLQMSSHANKAFDLSNASVSANPGVMLSNHPGVALFMLREGLS